MLLLWMAEYEKWASESEGIEYRRECVVSWLQLLMHADRMERHWRFLGK